MNTAAPALLALVLLCSLPAMTLVAASPGANAGTETHSSTTAFETTPHGNGSFLEVDGTTNRLLISGDNERTHVSPTQDFSTMVASADDELRVDANRFAFEQAFEETANHQARGELIDSQLEWIHDRVETLNEREQAAVRAHANGEITDGELTRALVRNYYEANELVRFHGELSTYTDRVSGYSIGFEMPRKIATHQSDARAEMVVAATYGHDLSVTVETHVDGYRLSMVAGDTYLQEVTRFDLRDPDGESQFDSFGAAEEHATERYPWALGTANSYRFHAAAGNHLFLTEITHNHGELYAYIDGATEEVTREHQSLFVSRLPTEPANGTWNDESLQISLNRTPAHGPAEVTVTDRETGDPVQATISIDGHVVGETDEDGILWIAPPIGSYELTAETDDQRVVATPSR
ncbi:DUF7096 domain-containing protein [Natronosalvus vescus]|uniref:DUF7096 domain-containing protein n=1 Tax=Natronosalvus vescus TaxID=2953881 RepID=UPI0020901DE4|nr:hypothetical protein [Natronosalvus vescus]